LTRVQCPHAAAQCPPSTYAVPRSQNPDTIPEPCSPEAKMEPSCHARPPRSPAAATRAGIVPAVRPRASCSGLPGHQRPPRSTGRRANVSTPARDGDRIPSVRRSRAPNRRCHQPRRALRLCTPDLLLGSQSFNGKKRQKRLLAARCPH